MQIQFFQIQGQTPDSPQGWREHLRSLVDNSAISEGCLFQVHHGFHLYVVHHHEDTVTIDDISDSHRTQSENMSTGLSAVQQFYYDILGKESPQIGDPELQQSLEKEFQQCVNTSLVGPVLRELMDRARNFINQTRETTELSIGAVTPHQLSIELSRRIMEGVRHATVAIVGNPFSPNHFQDFWSQQEIERLFLIHTDGKNWSPYHIGNTVPIPWEDRRRALTTSDIIILDSDETAPAITRTVVQENLRQRKNHHLLILNWSDFQPLDESISKIPAVFTYTKAELQKALTQARKRRAQVVESLAPEIDDEVMAMYEWLHSDKPYEFRGMVGGSREMQAIFELIQRVAATDITVLVQGETGTGKELVAQAIHHLSQRKNGPFVAVNCGAIPETLLESELFGHKKGAFTGAESDRTGLLKAASGGTVFLDEIGDTSQMFQVKLLRVLQEREITPLGTSFPESIDVRIITATRKDLRDEVAQGNFRSDLFYRVNVVKIALPPLRNRKSDILPLVRHFIRKYNQRMGKKIQGVTEQVAEALLNYPWPGNVRELENVIERAIALSLGNELHLGDLPAVITDSQESQSVKKTDDIKSLEQIEEEYITRLIKEFDGNYAEVAELLGIGRTTLWRKMKKYGLKE